VKKHQNNFETLFTEVHWNSSFQQSWHEVYDTIKDIPKDDTYTLQWNPVNKEQIMKILVDKHDFSQDRISKTLERFEDKKQQKSQKGLNEFFT